MKKEIPYMDSTILLHGFESSLEFVRMTQEEAERNIEYAKANVADFKRELAFSQEWYDSRISKPEFSKRKKHRAAMRAEKAKRVEKKGEKSNAVVQL